jgi:hypothetical protein
MAWSSPKVGEYRIHYEDGKIERVVLQKEININDWWQPGDLSEALLGVVKENKLSQGVGLWVMPWSNPRTEIKITSIDFESYGKALPILVALTGEKTSPHPVTIDDGSVDISWSVINDGKDGKGEKPTATRVDKTAEPFLPRGNSAMKIDMPAQTKDGTPAVFVHFDKKQVDPSHRYLSFWIKAATDCGLSIVLPKDDWKASLATSITIRKSDGWKKIELDLDEDLGLKKKDWKITDLRGELFIYNRPASGTALNPGASFILNGVRLE